MRRFILYFALLITFFVIQGTAFPVLFTGKVVPNLVLVFVVSFGLMRGKKTGLILGFLEGLLLDIFCANVVGFYALLLMYLGYLSGFFNKIFYPEDVKLPMGLIAACDLIYGFMSYVALFLLKGKLNISYYFVNVAIPECVYTTLVTILIYPLLNYINRALERSERKQARKFV